VRKHFLLQNLQKYQKKKARVSHWFFAKNLEKNILSPENQLSSANPPPKKTSAKLYSLSYQPVRKKEDKIGIVKFSRYVIVQKYNLATAALRKISVFFSNNE